MGWQIVDRDRLASDPSKTEIDPNYIVRCGSHRAVNTCLKVQNIAVTHFEAEYFLRSQ
jgi:hypothetical protein